MHHWLPQVWQGGFESINRDAGDPWRGQAMTADVKEKERLPRDGWHTCISGGILAQSHAVWKYTRGG